MSEHNTNIVVVALIRDDNNRILITRRSATKKFAPNRFELPGGHLEIGETLEDGLKREIKEEIGVEITVEKLIDAFTYSDEETYKVELLYLCKLKPGSEPVLNPEDHSEMLWINGLEINKFEKDDEETEALRKSFKILQGGKDE